MKPLFFKSIVTLALIICMIVSFFWVDIAAKLVATTAGLFTDKVVAGEFTPDESDRITGFRLVSEINDLNQIRIQNMRSGVAANGSIDVFFDLVNLEGQNQFPSLRVFLMNPYGRTLRTLEFSANEYKHGSIFQSETVTLTLHLAADEAKFTVSPFYPE